VALVKVYMHREGLGDAIGAREAVQCWRQEGMRSTYNMADVLGSTTGETGETDKTDEGDQSLDRGQDDGKTTSGGSR
jgi:hypothetical protein